MDNIKLTFFEDKSSNYKLLYNWCSQPYIYEWFEQRQLTYEEIVSKYKNKLNSKKQQLFFISYNKKPIGFVQIYNYEGKNYKTLTNYSIIIEYDIFIGDKNYLSKGIGTVAIRIINDFIFNNKGDCIILRPFKRNVRAIKCYEKNGFRVIDEYNDFDTIGNKETFVVLIKVKG